MPVDFANYLWEKYNSSYISLKKSIHANDIDPNIVKEVQKQGFFIKEALFAQKNLKRIKKEWKHNKKDINEFLNKIFKCPIELTTTGYIFSPQFREGCNIGNNEFLWVHENGLENSNYDLVYLVHESLHSFFDLDDLSHTIIENISDVELSKTLNKTKYGYQGHKFLRDYHAKMLPYWNLYLNRSQEEIAEEQKYQKVEYNAKDFEKYRNKLSTMDILEFTEFAKQTIGELHNEKSPDGVAKE